MALFPKGLYGMYADENEVVWYNREVENGSPWKVPPVAEETLLNVSYDEHCNRDEISLSAMQF
ncbi:hypothetical protein PsorP6_007540 [Peronosclerospora sorghi]|uniref:Uncharacterized protein n=1 Tax=Peronosclerospora sorghi TaxID=230839 RepID=A0ACC0WAT6_9STRA|nr:hypothetical protein PsorP6_007540 [Peronosclerospora sorghi]